MTEKLTPQHAQAVYDRGGTLLVSAAAGSGKTKVLVDRLMVYLRDPIHPANIDDFLMITYTKAAAAELRGKIAAKLTELQTAEPENRHLRRQTQRLYLAKISTVHAFCGDLLREYAYRLDLSADFRVADENECVELRHQVLERVLDQAYEQAAEDPDFRAFADTQGLGRNDALVPEIVLKVYDSARCHLDPQQWLQDCIKSAEVPTDGDAGQTCWGKYLIEDLFSWLDLQMDAMERCIAAAERLPELKKQTENLRNTLYQLQRLRQSESWDEIVRNKDIDYGRLVFPKKITDLELADRIKAVRDTCKKSLTKKLRSFADDSRLVMEDLSCSASAVRGLVGLVNAFGDAYTRAKDSRRILDFSDLEHKTLDLLLGSSRSGITAAARETGERFCEILVDEYQDSNEVQDAIFSALTQKRQNCFMVGDVKQSIYQFRLADPGIFLDKYARYVPAEQAQPGQGRKVLLSQNFRSGGAVLAAVNDVFETCMSENVGGLVYGEDEALHEGVPHVPLGEPEVELYAIPAGGDAYGREAAFVAERIRQLLDGTHSIRQFPDTLRPVKPEDIVILLRSPGSIGGHYRRALEAVGIRCCSGGGGDLLKTMEIAMLRSLLQTISNPRQDIPLLSVLAGPVFGFTADDLAAFRSRDRNGTVYDALCMDDSAKSKRFLKVLATLRREAGTGTLPQLLERIFTLTRMDSIFAAMENGEERLENLQTFYQMAVGFCAGGNGDLNRFLEHVRAMEAKGLGAAGEQTAAGAVTIMSIHKSKGLEFPVVFLCGLSREFNRESQRAQVLCDRELGIGLSAVDSKNRVRYPTIAKRAIAAKMTAESLSEELRVLYVAMTRAKDRLIMTYTAQKLQDDLKNIAMRSGIGSRELLTRDVVCPGEWVLLSAMGRTEAGELFALGGRPMHTKPGEPAWKIRVTDGAGELAAGEATEEEPAAQMPQNAPERLSRALAFTYDYLPATSAPSKQTATQRKGRYIDTEVAEHTGSERPFTQNWRKASFVEKQIRGTDYGTTVHAVMQYVCYEACGSLAGVEAEVRRLVERGFLTEEQGKMVRCRDIAAFFATGIGEKLRGGGKSLREFKFSILDEGSLYGPGLEGEQILLQGVVDCALLEDDGITLVDFKTDYVTEETVDAAAERYRPQVEAYADALSRIFETRVKEKLLYFFRLNKFISL